MAIRETDLSISDTIVCVGNSMYPTLRVLDVLYVQPYVGRKISRGDVIVFQASQGRKVTHRIVSITSRGILTRGDNNRDIDIGIIQSCDVLGQVVRVRRNKKLLRVRGGLFGQLIGYICRISLMIKYHFIYVLRPAYDVVSKSGVFRLWLPARLRPYVLSFSRPEGKELQVLMGNKIVGIYNTNKEKWIIKPPYRLFVDELSLPVPD